VQEKQGRAKWVRTVRKESPPGSLDEYLQNWEAFFDHYAAQVDRWHHRNTGYHTAIASLARFYVPADAGYSKLAAATVICWPPCNLPMVLGIDISGQMVRLAARKYPHLQFRQMAAEHLELPEEPFDFIVLSDLVGYLYDIRLVFERLRHMCHSHTRLVIHWYSHLWQPLLAFAEKLG